MMPSQRAQPESVPKAYRGGTDRLVTPQETLARVRPLMAAMGITRIANVTGLDTIGIPVTMVTRPNARTLSVAQGKGIDLVTAQVSGLMEAVESYHAERITLPLKLASYEELRYTDRLIDPALLPHRPHQTSHPYRPMHWIEGHDLLHDESVWVPYDSVHLNLTSDFHQHDTGLVVSSNGLGAGNHLLEAISHALCEVVERDATTLWYLTDEPTRAATRIDLATVTDSRCCALLEKFARADVLVGVWEITSNIGITAFLCRAVDAVDHPLHRRYFNEAMGCHPTREIAFLRALTEVAQSRLTWIAGSRDDSYPEHYIAMRDPDLNERHRAALTAAGLRRSFVGPSWQADTFDADLGWELERLRAGGIERVVVVNLTRSDLRIPVVKVVIPGLEGVISGDYTPGPRARLQMATVS